MRKMLSRTLVVLAITSVAALGADNSIGTWKVNMAKSKYTPAPMPLKSYTMMRESIPGGVKVTITGERSDGAPINATYTAKFDGSASPVTGSGAPYDSIALKQVDANTFTYEAKNATTKYHSNMRLVVAGDGKSLTTTGKGTDADGKPMNLTLVLEK
jgi:hypothetical protein